MPKSKTRRPAKPKTTRQQAPLLPEEELERKTLALVEASLELVRDAERAIALAAWRSDAHTSPELTAALDIHHHIRTGSLALLVAYSKLAGLPDPRESPMIATD